MNKIIVRDDINLKDGLYNLKFSKENTIINLDGKIKLFIYKSNFKKVTFNILDNSDIKIEGFDNNYINNQEIIINQNNNTKLLFNFNFITKCDSIFIVKANILGNNNNLNINIRNIAMRNNSKIDVYIDAHKGTKNNIALEDIKGINNGGIIEVIPNIICNTNEVIANHKTSIGYLDKDMINYLLSKGISLLNAKKILLKGFIYSNESKEMKELREGYNE